MPIPSLIDPALRRRQLAAHGTGSRRCAETGLGVGHLHRHLLTIDYVGGRWTSQMNYQEEHNSELSSGLPFATVLTITAALIPFLFFGEGLRRLVSIAQQVWRTTANAMRSGFPDRQEWGA
jgi:hypothetical protein